MTTRRSFFCGTALFSTRTICHAETINGFQCLPEVREKLFAGDTSGAWGALASGFHYANGVNGFGAIGRLTKT